MTAIVKSEDLQQQLQTVSEETAKSFSQVLMSGKSDVAMDILAHKGTDAEQAGNVAGMLAGARILIGREASAKVGQAVACYVLTHSTDKTPAYLTGRQVAEALGLTPGRVSQLAGEGAVYVNLGLPEGWQGASVTRDQLRAVLSGAGSKDIRALATGKKAASTRQKAIAEVVRKAEEKKAADKEKAAAQRANEKAVREASRPKAPKVEGQATETAPVPLTVDQVGTAVSTFEDVAAVLLSQDLTPSQTRVVAGIVAQLAGKFPTS